MKTEGERGGGKEGKRDYLNRIVFPLSFYLSDFRKIDEVMPFPIFSIVLESSHKNAKRD